jgi:hypothetical protein
LGILLLFEDKMCRKVGLEFSCYKILYWIDVEYTVTDVIEWRLDRVLVMNGGNGRVSKKRPSVDLSK